MPISKSSLLLVAAALSWPAIDAIGQNPPRGQGQEQGAQDPGPPPPPGDEPGGPPPPPPPPPFGPPPNFLFMAIDTDDDGELSPKEIAKAGETILKLDKNKDGIISELEVRPPPPPGRPLGPPAANNRQDAKALVDSVMRFDKDADGKVTAKELPERMARMLEQGDTNKDGALERSEIETLSSRTPPRRPGPPGGGPPGPPPGPPPAVRGGAADEDGGRPVEQVARDLGVTPEKFREVFRKVRPAGPGRQPTEAQRRQNRKVLSEGLGVSPEKLDEVMDKYRPGGRGDNGPPPR